ncbi:MAG: hypothetical protein KC425_13335 [Anaerolineales bacterium]|nr:hypothetical protein [Anaerolineales bacterium]
MRPRRLLALAVFVLTMVGLLAQAAALQATGLQTRRLKSVDRFLSAAARAVPAAAGHWHAGPTAGRRAAARAVEDEP